MILKQAIQFAFCFGLPRIILPMVPRFVNATIKAKEEVYVVFGFLVFFCRTDNHTVQDTTLALSNTRSPKLTGTQFAGGVIFMQEALSLSCLHCFTRDSSILICSCWVDVRGVRRGLHHFLFLYVAVGSFLMDSPRWLGGGGLPFNGMKTL